jgi:hypothetical protein
MVLKLEEDGKLTLLWLDWMDWSKQWMEEGWNRIG